MHSLWPFGGPPQEIGNDRDERRSTRGKQALGCENGSAPGEDWTHWCSCHGTDPRREAPVMPSPLVVDASVVLKRQLEDEEGVPQALALRDDFLLHSRIDLTAPSLLLYEVTNAILTAARRGRLSLVHAPPCAEGRRRVFPPGSAGPAEAPTASPGPRSPPGPRGCPCSSWSQGPSLGPRVRIQSP